MGMSSTHNLIPDMGPRSTGERSYCGRWSPGNGLTIWATSLCPPGRFVSGVTQTPVGEVTVVGICIPWFGSRAESRRGPEKKIQWEDHAQYLDCLSELLKGMHDRPLIIVGDFNQRIGQESSAPRKLRSALQSVLPEDMVIATSALGFRGRRCFDHMAVSAETGGRVPERNRQHVWRKKAIGPLRYWCGPVCPESSIES